VDGSWFCCVSGDRKENVVNKKDQALADQYAELQRTIKNLNEERQKIYQDVVEMMERNGIHRVTTPSGSLRLYEKGYRDWDLQAAEEVLGKRRLMEVSRVSIVGEKIDAKVKLGEIDPRALEKFCVVTNKMELRLY